MSPRKHFLNKKMLAGGHPFAACCSVALRPLGAAEVFHQRTGCRRWAAHAKRRGEVHPVLLVYGVTHCAMPHQVIVVTLFQNVSLFLNKKNITFHHYRYYRRLLAAGRHSRSPTHPPFFFLQASMRVQYESIQASMSFCGILLNSLSMALMSSALVGGPLNATSFFSLAKTCSQGLRSAQSAG